MNIRLTRGGHYARGSPGIASAPVLVGAKARHGHRRRPVVAPQRIVAGPVDGEAVNRATVDRARDFGRLGQSVGGLRCDPTATGDQSKCPRTVDRDQIVGAGRGDAHSRREGHAGCIFRSVGSVCRGNSAWAGLRPAESDRSCPAIQPRDACGMGSNTRLRGQAWDCGGRLPTHARRHRYGQLCPPPGLRQDGAVPGPHRCARAVAAAGLAVAGLRSAHRGSRQRGPDPACRQFAV